MHETELNYWGYDLIKRVQQDHIQIAGRQLEFSIFFSPLHLKPKLLILGDNPGGGMDEKGLTIIPDQHEYLTKEYRMADMMRFKILKDELLEILSTSVKTNRIFFRTRDLSEFRKLDNYQQLIAYCKELLHEIIDKLQPQNILAESFGSFRSISATEEVILVKPNTSKALLLKGIYKSIPVFGINHPSRASYHKITDHDWELVNRALKQVLLNP